MFGAIKNVNHVRRFAFIRAMQTDFHFKPRDFTGNFSTLQRGTKVSFEPGPMTDRGATAVRVALASQATNSSEPVRFGQRVPDTGQSGE
jgi:hypothetical protein